jgi:hypothetical protein
VEQLKEDQAVVANWKVQPLKAVKKPVNYFSLLAALPLHLYVWINNFLPYSIISWLLKKFVTREFKGSLKVGFGMVIVPFFYLLQTVLVQMTFSDWRVTLAYAITLPFLSVWSVDVYKSAMNCKQ